MLVKLLKHNISELKCVHSYSAAADDDEEENNSDNGDHCVDGRGGNDGFQSDRL
jgi:hypothetical protein